jgi:hypothetical protein
MLKNLPAKTLHFVPNLVIAVVLAGLTPSLAMIGDKEEKPTPTMITSHTRMTDPMYEVILELEYVPQPKILPISTYEPRFYPASPQLHTYTPMNSKKHHPIFLF